MHARMRRLGALALDPGIAEGSLDMAVLSFRVTRARGLSFSWRY